LSKSESKDSKIDVEMTVEEPMQDPVEALEEELVLKDDFEENTTAECFQTQTVETKNIEIQDVEIQEMPEEVSAQLPTSLIPNDDTYSSFQNKLNCELDFENEPNESISPVTETAGIEPATEDMLTQTMSQSGVPQSFSQMTFEELETMKNDVLDPVSNHAVEEVRVEESEILKEEEDETEKIEWDGYEPVNLNDPDYGSPVVEDKIEAEEFEVEEKFVIEENIEIREAETDEKVENEVEANDFEQKLSHQNIYQQVDEQDMDAKLNNNNEFEVNNEFYEVNQQLDGGYDHPEIVNEHNEQWEQLTAQDQNTPTSVEFNDYKQFLPHQNTIVEQDSVEIGIADQANQQTLNAINEGVRELENSVVVDEFKASFEVGKGEEEEGGFGGESFEDEEIKSEDKGQETHFRIDQTQPEISQVNQFEANEFELNQLENSNQFHENPFRQEIVLDESTIENNAFGENAVGKNEGKENIAEKSVDIIEIEASPMESNMIPLHEEETVINSEHTVYETPEAEEMEFVIENKVTSDLQLSDLHPSDLQSCKITDSVTVTPETEFPITQIEAMKNPTDLITSENEATAVGEQIVLDDEFGIQNRNSNFEIQSPETHRSEANHTEIFIKHEVRESTQIYESTEMLKEELSEIENLVNECFDPETKDSEVAPPIACPTDLTGTFAAEVQNAVKVQNVPYTELVDTDVENEIEFENANTRGYEDHETISLTSRSPQPDLAEICESERVQVDHLGETRAEEVCLEKSAAMVDDNSVNVDTSLIMDSSVNLENSDRNATLDKTTVDIFGNRVDVNGRFDSDKFETGKCKTEKYDSNQFNNNQFQTNNTFEQPMITSNNYSEITEGPDDLSEEENCAIAEVPPSTAIQTDEIPDSSKFDDTNADNATRNFFSEDDDADYRDHSLMAEAPSNAFMPDSPAVHAGFEGQRDLNVGADDFVVSHGIQQDVQQDIRQDTHPDTHQETNFSSEILRQDARNSSEFNYQQEISTLKSGSVLEEDSLHSGNDTSYTNPNQTTSIMGVGVSSLGAPAIELLPATPNPPSTDIQNMIMNASQVAPERPAAGPSLANQPINQDQTNKPEDDSLPNSEYNNGYQYEVYNSKYNSNNNSNNRSSWLGNLNNNSNRDSTKESTRETTREKTRQTRSDTKTTTRRSGRASESVPPPRTKRVPLTSRKSDGVKSQNTSSRNNNGHVLYFDLVIIPRLDGAGDAQDFFENVRSNYYVLNSDADTSNTDILDHAINGINAWNNLSKQTSSEKCQPTIIPTSTVNNFSNWLELRGEDIGKAGVCFIASGSKVIISDDEIEACKVQF